MGRLTKWQIAWWDAQPRAQVCRRCEKEGDRAYVQPQLPRHKGGPGRGALCGDCINAINEEHRAKRRVELAQRPKCERCGRRPFTFYAGDQRFEVCGWCLKETRRQVARAASGVGYLALFTGASALISTAGWKHLRPGRVAQ